MKRENKGTTGAPRNKGMEKTRESSILVGSYGAY